MEYSSTSPPMHAPMKANRTLNASTCRTRTRGESHWNSVRSIACPLRTEFMMPTTARMAGTQDRNASIPFVLAEQSRATSSCSNAPNRSEHGAIKMRVAAVMSNHVELLFYQHDVTLGTGRFGGAIMRYYLSFHGKSLIRQRLVNGV